MADTPRSRVGVRPAVARNGSVPDCVSPPGIPRAAMSPGGRRSLRDNAPQRSGDQHERPPRSVRRQGTDGGPPPVGRAPAPRPSGTRSPFRVRRPAEPPSTRRTLAPRRLRLEEPAHACGLGGRTSRPTAARPSGRTRSCAPACPGRDGRDRSVARGAVSTRKTYSHECLDRPVSAGADADGVRTEVEGVRTSGRVWRRP
jgi:hypothetical protein